VVMPDYDFQVVNSRRNNQVVFKLSGIDLNSLNLPKDFYGAYHNPFTDEFFYQESLAPQSVVVDGIDISMAYQRYIWVLDYIEGDILTSQPKSIERESTTFLMNDTDERQPLTPQEIRAVVIREKSASTRSTTVAHTHFHRERGNLYEVNLSLLWWME